MTVLTVSIIIGLLCNCIYSDDILSSTQLVFDSSTVANSCTDESQCPYPDICTQCNENREPDCDRPVCIDGRCGMIERCSQVRSSTTPPFNQCTGTDTSFCVINFLCAHCPEGYSPGCNEAVCVNDACLTIPACSIYTPTQSTTTSTESSTPADECEDDSQCPYPKYCAVQCENGVGPLCASAKCIDRKCQIIRPCSQTTQCTDQDLNQCVTPHICALCKEGYSPPCARATCKNGQCSVIGPCSIFDQSTTTTMPSVSVCSSNSDCPRRKCCAAKCDNGTTPLCASAKCVKGRCIHIAPCSQRTCKTRTTCPYNKRNCARCARGFGPGCEQAACSCGICSLVPPCSKKIEVTASISPGRNT